MSVWLNIERWINSLSLPKIRTIGYLMCLVKDDLQPLNTEINDGNFGIADKMNTHLSSFFE